MSDIQSWQMCCFPIFLPLFLIIIAGPWIVLFDGPHFQLDLFSTKSRRWNSRMIMVVIEEC